MIIEIERRPSDDFLKQKHWATKSTVSPCRPKCFDWPTESRDTFVRISLEIYLFAAVYTNENRPIDYIFFPLPRASCTLNYNKKIIREKSVSPSLCIPLDGA